MSAHFRGPESWGANPLTIVQGDFRASAQIFPSPTSGPGPLEESEQGRIGRKGVFVRQERVSFLQQDSAFSQDHSVPSSASIKSPEEGVLMSLNSRVCKQDLSRGLPFPPTNILASNAPLTGPLGCWSCRWHIQCSSPSLSILIVKEAFHSPPSLPLAPPAPGCSTPCLSALLVGGDTLAQDFLKLRGWEVTVALLSTLL